MTLKERCLYCNEPMEGESCELATLKKTVNGKEMLLCCRNCASSFEKKQ